MFSQFMMIQQSWQVSMRDMVEYELGSVSWIFWKPNGEMWSIPKSNIVKDIEKEIPLTTSLPENPVRVFNAMVLMQKLPERLNTFGDVSNHILNRITKNKSRCVCLVAISIIQPQIKVWKEKQDLVLVRFEQLQDKGNRTFQGSWWLFLWVIGLVHSIMYRWQGNICHCEKRWLQNLLQKQYTILCWASWSLLWSRKCSKMFLCAACTLSYGFSLVCIVTIDTYISILGCYFFNKLEGNLFIKILTKPTRIFNFI